MTRSRLFGFEVDPLRMSEAVARVLEWVERRDGVCRFVVTPNADHAVVYQENAKLRQAYPGDIEVARVCGDVKTPDAPAVALPRPASSGD